MEREMPINWDVLEKTKSKVKGYPVSELFKQLPLKQLGELATFPYTGRISKEAAGLGLQYGPKVFPAVAAYQALKGTGIGLARGETFPEALKTGVKNLLDIEPVRYPPEFMQKVFKRGIQALTPTALSPIATQTVSRFVNEIPPNIQSSIAEAGIDLAGIYASGFVAAVGGQALKTLSPDKVSTKAWSNIEKTLLKNPQYKGWLNKEVATAQAKGLTGVTTEDVHSQFRRLFFKDFVKKMPYIRRFNVALGQAGKLPGKKPTQLPFFEAGKKRIGKVTQLPRGEDFILKGLPTTKGLSPRQRLLQEQKRIQEEQLGFILKGKPRTIEVPREGMVTSEQTREAHIIARGKALVTPKGKTKPGYRRLATVMTGKKSMKDMTSEEADGFITALKSIPEPIRKPTGEIVPPSIPTTTRLTTEGFFQRKFKTPTKVGSLLTSDRYYSTLLGTGELTEPLELAKQQLDLEERALERAIDRQEQVVNKIGKTTLPERVISNIRNQPTPAMLKMNELLNTYETPPPFLSPTEKNAFMWYRNLSGTMLKGQNEVYRTLGIREIPHRQAYVRRVAEGVALDLLQGKYPFPEGLKYWSQQVVSKNVYNPMAMQRKLTEDLENYFTKDLSFASKAMVRTGLKVIHLSQPLRTFKEQMGAFTKDVAQYKNLPPEELAEVRKIAVLPASTRKWVNDYVNQRIKGQQTELDIEANKAVTDSGLGGLLNKVLKPFGRTIGRKPLTNIFSGLGRSIIHAVMGPIPRQLVRNKFQLTQLMSLYTTKANLKGFLPASVDKNLKELVDRSMFFKSYTGIEEMPVDVRSRLEKLWMAPYQWTAITNAGQAMKVAYWDTLELVTKPKFSKFGWADPQRTYKEPKGFLYPSEKETLLKEMEFGAGVTQYTYIPMGMPGIFRHKVLTPITRLQSWWMNYFTKFTRESIHRAIKGSPSYNENIKYPWSRRVGYLKYLLIGGALLSTLGYKRSFLLGVLPTYLSPAAQLALGFYTYLTTDSDWERKKAVWQMKNSWRAFIPGSGAWRAWGDVWTGKKPLKSLFFYTPPTGKAVGVEFEFEKRRRKVKKGKLNW